jgi:hypothetical protein
MPIEMPNTPTSSTAPRSLTEHVRCSDFVFRIADVDGFSHRPMSEGDSITIVNFKGYTQSVRDPERRLFDFLVLKLRAKPTE